MIVSNVSDQFSDVINRTGIFQITYKLAFSPRLNLLFNFYVKSTAHRQDFGPIGPVKLLPRVKIARLFLQSVSNLFHFIILSLLMNFNIWLSKNLLKHTFKIEDIGRFNQSLLIESF